MQTDARKPYGRGKRPRRPTGDGFAGAALAVFLWLCGCGWLVGHTFGWW